MPELEVAYQKFLKQVYAETENPEWNIENHPARKILDQFPKEFGKWVEHLEKLLLIKKGGYSLKNNDLSLTEWKALGFLENRQKMEFARNNRINGW